MKKKLFKKVLTLAVAGAMVLGMTVPAMADNSPTLDSSATGSLTIVKYDGAAQSDENYSSLKDAASKGEASSAFETAMSDYALSGIVFSYIKVGSVAQYEFYNSTTGEYEEELVYSISTDLESVLTSLGGLSTSDAVHIGDDASTDYYTSDVLNAAMQTALNVSSKGYAGYNALYEIATGDDATDMTATGDNGKTSATSLEVGLYLVVETQVSDSVNTTTAPFLVSIPMIDASGTGWNYNVTVYPKNQTDEEMQPDKGVKVSGSEEEYTDYLTSADTGDTLAYSVGVQLGEITSEATYYKKIVITDKLSEGMSYDKTSVTVTFYETEEDYLAGNNAEATWTAGDYFTFTTSGTYQTGITGTLTITSTATTGGLAQINPNYSGYYMVITYNVKIEDASLLTYGDEGNENDVTVTWSRTNDEDAEKSDEAKVAYYGIDLTKVFGSDGGSFEDVKFILKDSDGNKISALYDSTAGVYYVCKSGTSSSVTEFTPDENGVIKIEGLPAGTYYLEETETTSGFNLLDDDITIVITGGVWVYAEKTEEVNGEQVGTGEYEWTEKTPASATIDGQTATWASDGTDDPSGHAMVMLEVNNTKGFTLPVTGGMGTMLVVIIGAVIICLAVVVGNRSKKRKAA